MCLQNLLEDTNSQSPDEAYETSYDRQEMLKLLEPLTDREQQTIKLLFGFSTPWRCTSSSIANQLGVSTVRANQIVQEALYKLREKRNELNSFRE